MNKKIVVVSSREDTTEFSINIPFGDDVIIRKALRKRGYTEQFDSDVFNAFIGTGVIVSIMGEDVTIPAPPKAYEGRGTDVIVLCDSLTMCQAEVA